MTRKLEGKEDTKDRERAENLKRIQDDMSKPGNLIITNPRKTREKLTETEQIFLAKMFTAYLAQYPLVSKGKRPDRYKFNHQMAESIKKKLIRIKILPKE